MPRTAAAKSVREPGRSSLFLKRLLLAFASLVVSALLCEGLLRLLWDNPFSQEHHDFIVHLRIQNPLEDYPIDRSDVDPASPIARLRIDERAYIRPSRRFEDPDATIVFLGGSTTECAAVDEDLRFPALVSRLLEERHGLRVNALNAAKSGNTSHESLNVLINHVVADAPNVAVMMHAANDIGTLARRGSYRLGEPIGAGTVLPWMLRRGSTESSLLGALRLWLAGARWQRRQFDVRAESPIERIPLATGGFVSRLRAYVGVARAFGIEPVLMTQPLTSVRTPLTPNWTDPVNQEIFNHEIRQVAAEEGAVLIDLVRHLFDHVEGWNEPMRVFYDGVHVTDSGSRIYAEHIVERLAESVFARRIASDPSVAPFRSAPLEAGR